MSSGDQKRKPVIDEFLFRRQPIEAVNIAGMTSIEEISTIIKHARLLVCHDSGLMHIGNAHRTPLVALHGPTDLVFTEPKASTSRVIRRSLPCIPCMRNFAKTEAEALRDCPIDVQCMRDLSVEEVYRACREMLAMQRVLLTSARSIPIVKVVEPNILKFLEDAPLFSNLGGSKRCRRVLGIT